MGKSIKNDPGKDEINFSLEEYKSLRAEILSKMDNQYKILSLGIGGIAILFGVIDKIGIKELFIVMPFLVIANAFLYRIETIAIINAGFYIRNIENIIYHNHKSLKIYEKMGWENQLDRAVYKPFNYVADIIFIGLYFLSVIKVFQCYIIPAFSSKMTLSIIVCIIYLLVILSLFIRYVWLIKKYQKLINDVSQR